MVVVSYADSNCLLSVFLDLSKTESTIKITKITIQQNITSIFSTGAPAVPFKRAIVLTALLKRPC